MEVIIDYSPVDFIKQIFNELIGHFYCIILLRGFVRKYSIVTYALYHYKGSVDFPTFISQ